MDHTMDRGRWAPVSEAFWLGCRLPVVGCKLVRKLKACKKYTCNSGGFRTQNLWGQLVSVVGPSHIWYGKITLVLSKPVGPDGPTGYT
jgi:hypothetical protein